MGWILAKFWKISKNRLATLKARQAAHAANVLFLGSAMHCLAAKGSLPGDTYWVAQFLLIFLILLGRILGFEWGWYDGLSSVKNINWGIKTLILMELEFRVHEDL